MQVAPHIVLVHGLARSRFDMFLMAPRLRARFPETRVHVFDYHSRRLTLEQATDRLREFVDSITTTEPVSFVGHSLGGIITRSLDATGGCRAPMHRLVTLGTPHYGAVIARFLADYTIPNVIFGPMLHELGVLNLPEQSRQLEIGCLVGGTNTWIGFLPVFREDNDGVVLVREAHLKTCVDHKRMPMLHALFPFSWRVADLAASFLATGSFAPMER